MLVLAAGKYEQVLMVLATLAAHYGWNGRVGAILADLVLDKGKGRQTLGGGAVGRSRNRGNNPIGDLSLSLMGRVVKEKTHGDQAG